MSKNKVYKITRYPIEKSTKIDDSSVIQLHSSNSDVAGCAQKIRFGFSIACALNMIDSVSSSVVSALNSNPSSTPRPITEKSASFHMGIEFYVISAFNVLCIMCATYLFIRFIIRDVKTSEEVDLHRAQPIENRETLISYDSFDSELYIGQGNCCFFSAKDESNELRKEENTLVSYRNCITNILNGTNLSKYQYLIFEDKIKALSDLYDQLQTSLKLQFSRFKLEDNEQFLDNLKCSMIEANHDNDPKRTTTDVEKNIVKMAFGLKEILKYMSTYQESKLRQDDKEARMAIRLIFQGVEEAEYQFWANHLVVDTMPLEPVCLEKNRI